MKKEKLTQDIYNRYYNESYIFSLLCSKDILTKLEQDYSSGFVLEEYLFTGLSIFLKESGKVFLSDNRINNNLNIILANDSKKNNDIKNEIVTTLNSIDFNSEYSYPFLRTQYLFRKYGFKNVLKIRLYRKYIKEARDLSDKFLTQSNEQLYDSIDFDFKLISALPKLEDDPGLIYDDCLSNYQLFASLNYFKSEYPYMFKDETFLSFVKSIVEFQNLERKEINDESCLFDDFYSENQKTLDYVKKRINRL